MRLYLFIDVLMCLFKALSLHIILIALYTDTHTHTHTHSLSLSPRSYVPLNDSCTRPVPANLTN